MLLPHPSSCESFKVFTLVQNFITNLTSSRASLFTISCCFYNFPPPTPNFFIVIIPSLRDSIQEARIPKQGNLPDRKGPLLESIKYVNYMWTVPAMAT